MPPGKPGPGYNDFKDACILTKAEIATLAAWVKEGTPQGDPAEAPAVPATLNSNIAQPDLLARMSKPFTVPSDGPDVYRCFVIPLGLNAKRYVDRIEFRPGNPKVTHHALFFL